MTFGTTRRIAAVAFAATCAATSTWAVPMASASLDLGSLRYSFTDRDATDGIDASLEFQGGGTFAETCLTAIGDGTCAWGGMGQVEWGGLTYAVSTSDAIPGLQGAASAQAGAGLLHSMIQGVTPGGERSVNVDRFATVLAHGAGHIHFSLDYNLFADAGGAPSFQDALAWAGIVVSPDLDYFGKHFQFDAVLHRPGTGTASNIGTLVGDFDVQDGHQYFIEARAHTNVDTIPAVPEPESWALMLLGLGGMAAVAARRKRA